MNPSPSPAADFSGPPEQEQSDPRPYVAPQIVHEDEMEIRAGSALPLGGDPSVANPWDPDYSIDTGQ